MRFKCTTNAVGPFVVHTSGNAPGLSRRASGVLPAAGVVTRPGFLSQARDIIGGCLNASADPGIGSS